MIGWRTDGRPSNVFQCLGGFMQHLESAVAQASSDSRHNMRNAKNIIMLFFRIMLFYQDFVIFPGFCSSSGLYP